MAIENKHTLDELRQWQALPLAIKVRMTKNRIRGWIDEYGTDGVYVSISGGKDSQVLAHLVRQDYPNVKLVFVNTGLEYESVRKKAQSMADVELLPEMNFLQVLQKYGYPIISKEVSQAIYETKIKLLRQGIKTNFIEALENIPIDKMTIRDKQLLGIYQHDGKKSAYCKDKYLKLLDAPFLISSRCCNVMKKNTAYKYVKQTKSKPFIATMAEESRLRKSNWIKNGCNGFNLEHPQSTPLSFWTEQDILQYAKENGLKFADVYGEIQSQVKPEVDGQIQISDYGIYENTDKLTTTGVKRTGCVFCMFGITQDTERFVKLRDIEPKKYEYVMNGGEWVNGLWTSNKKGLGYKFVIDWLNSNLDLKIRY